MQNKPLIKTDALALLNEYPLFYVPIFLIAIFTVAWVVAPKWSDIQRQANNQEPLTEEEKGGVQVVALVVGIVVALAASRRIHDVVLNAAITLVATAAGVDSMTLIVTYISNQLKKIMGGGEDNHKGSSK